MPEDWYFCSHRLPLAVAAQKAGYDVVVATRVQKHGDQIVSQGLKLIPISFSRHSMNPFTEAHFIANLVRIYKKESPDIVHHIANKPILYGSLAAIFAKVPFTVNALTGVRYNIFFPNQWKIKLLRPWIKYAFKIALNKKNSRVILQNNDDLAFLIKTDILEPKNTVIIRGAGVNTKEFTFSDEPAGNPLVVLATRMLWDKGVGEFVKAARRLKKDYPQVRFILVGDTDIGNPAAIPIAQLEEWHKEKVIEWWGHREDMPAVFSESHIVCLPSYREGLPKVLIEAASCGRAIVATDVPGCREIVRHGVNGLLVPPKDSKTLAKSLTILIQNPELRSHMGKKGREIAVSEFSEERVTKETIGVYRDLLKNHWPSKNESHALC